MLWFVFALALGAVLTGLVLWLRNKGISVKWYEWLIGTIGLLLLLAAGQHYFASLAERYSTAGVMGGLAFAIPALILLAVTWQLIVRRQRAYREEDVSA